MAIILKVNTVDKSSLIDWSSIQKSEVLTKQASTLEFAIKNYEGKTYKPTIGDDITLFNGATKIFGGVLTEINETADGFLKLPVYFCKDYTEVLDGQLVSKTYENQTATAIITDIISTFATGFTVVNVVAPIVIDKVVFNYITVSQALEKITNMLVGYSWYVDYNKDINFFESAINLSPFNLTDTSQNFVFNSLQVKTTSHQIKNEIIIRGGEITSTTNRTEYFDGDGTSLIFAMGTKFNVKPTVTISAVNQTVGLDNIDTTGFNCYWNFNERTIRFGTAPVTAVNNIVVAGTYLYPLIFRKQEGDSILTYGLHQNLIIDKTIQSIDSANDRASVELARYSVPTMRAKFTTNTDGLMAGQQININSTVRGINNNYIIRSIQTDLRTPDALRYVVEAENADSIKMNDVLKKLLVTNASDQLVIQENENVQRYSLFKESVSITDAISASKTSGPYVWDNDSLTEVNNLVWDFGTWG